MRAAPRRLSFLPLLAVVFFNVSGGPYGVEDAVSVFGPGLTLLLLALTPLLVALPVALAMAEMGGALPEEGGYVTWVQRAFGPFWGFQVGWWSWLNSFVDVAVYPALFADYLRFWRPEMTAVERGIVALGFVWLLTALNLTGVRITGWGAVALAVGALAPIVALTGMAAARAHVAPWSPFAAPGQGLLSGLGVGVAVMMWNYSGWDMPSTVLGETRQPETAYRRALWWALPLIALANIMPVAATLSVTGDWQRWQTGQWPVAAATVGGPWLAHAVVAGAVTASAGLFLSLVLTNSRLPYVLAVQGQLPRWLAAIHARTGVPWAAVLVSSAGYSFFALASFKDLIVLNVWLYSLTLLLELAAFVALRLREPSLARPWRVGGGPLGLWLTAALPSAAALLAMATAGWKNTAAGVATALTGPAAWWWRARRG
ncbi:MAG TPA: APC family permease [Candidatus Eisenbacteria bacterium]|nr:APC family permease [Candidatus Eisenbacteria bacterium]